MVQEIWYYKAGVEYILGIKIEKGILKINPCIPKDWKTFSVRYKWKNTLYNILVENPNGNEIGVKKIVIDGIEQMSNEIRLQENAGVINVEVFLS